MYFGCLESRLKRERPQTQHGRPYKVHPIKIIIPLLRHPRIIEIGSLRPPEKPNHEVAEKFPFRIGGDRSEGNPASAILRQKQLIPPEILPRTTTLNLREGGTNAPLDLRDHTRTRGRDLVLHHMTMVGMEMLAKQIHSEHPAAR